MHGPHVIPGSNILPPDQLDIDPYSTSFSTVVLYIRDHGSLGFLANQYHLKIAPPLSFVIVRQYWLQGRIYSMFMLS